MKYFDLHTHTNFSDGEASLDYLICAARDKGYGLGISDHIFCGGNDTVDKIAAYVETVKRTEAFVGVEANIGEDYQLPTFIDKDIDYVIASIHSVEDREKKLYFSSYFCYRCGAAKTYTPNYDANRLEEYLETMLLMIERTMNSQRIDILGHATVNPMYEAMQNKAFLRDWDQAVIDLCVKNHVAIEISNLWKAPREDFLKTAYACGAKFSLGSDCHVLADVCVLDYPIGMVKKLLLSEDRLFIPKRK